MIKSNANSSPDSNQNDKKREVCSDDSPKNVYNRLTIRRRSYDQNLQNLSRVKQNNQFKKKRGSPSKGSPTFVKVCRSAKQGDKTSRSVNPESTLDIANIKPKSLKLGDITSKEDKKQKQLIKTRRSTDNSKLLSDNLNINKQNIPDGSKSVRNRIVQVKLSEQNEIFLRKQKSKDRKNELK